MHEPITLTLRDKDNNPIETISTTFQPADLDLLNQFVSATLRVRESRLLTRGLPATTSINCSLESGMQITCAPYDNSELFELLHVLRPLILSREVASFDKSIAILGRRFSNKRLSRHLRAIRRVFEDGELKAYMQITVGDQPVFDDSLLKTWLNGTQYHTDTEKALAWKKFENILGSDNAKALVMNQLHSKVKALLLLEHLVSLVLKKHKKA